MILNPIIAPEDPKDSCFEYKHSSYVSKDCKYSCEEDGCNSDLESAADKFDQNHPELECYSCKFARDAEGNVMPGSNDRCGDVSVINKVNTHKCPKYANAACYNSANWHTVSFFALPYTNFVNILK